MIASAVVRHTGDEDLDALKRFLTHLEDAIWYAHGGPIADALEECTSLYARMGLPTVDDWDGDQALVALTLINEIHNQLRSQHGETDQPPHRDAHRQLRFDFGPDLPF